MAADASFFNGVSYDGGELRTVINGAMLTHIENAVNGRSGIISGFIPSPSGTKLNLGEGLAAVSPEPTASSRGSYVVAYPGGQLSFDVADASFPRRDAVVARLRDSEYDGGATDSLVIEVLKGTPSASPSAPATPNGSLVVHHVNVAAGTGNVSVIDKRVWTAAPGGVMHGTSAERLALPTQHLRPSQQWHDSDTNIRRVWHTSGWFPDQPVSWRGQFPLTTGTLDVPSHKNVAPDWYSASGTLGSTINNMTVQRNQRVIKPTKDAPGRFDLYAQFTYERSSSDGMAWAGIQINSSDFNTTTFDALTGTSLAEAWTPLNKWLDPVRGSSASATTVSIALENVYLGSNDSILFYSWQSSGSTLGLLFNPLRTYCTMRRIGN